MVWLRICSMCCPSLVQRWMADTLIVDVYADADNADAKKADKKVSHLM